ncbi:hypothetical protein T069G_02102 [Trichoderma breve]|uniref:Uncharacterized protein n=1 Tax=Trichoderma breve TaxID=2034170 RepID=A0A9W9EEY0_9HYPO|nr:hypothetical protein T069G_02102 [Trichoderma breve]KAJ4865572.1 hypothetical protein T069G_02102 [Trichoderma breve]
MKRRANASEVSISHPPAKKIRPGINHDAATRVTWQGSPQGLRADWVFSNNSNVKWFTELTPFKSVTSSGAVEGVGTVNLPVKRDPDMRGPQAHHLLRLTNVLYTPSSEFNILGQSIFELAPSLTLGSTLKTKGTLEGQPDEVETKPRQRAGQQPYTAEEKAWLKKHYQGEYKFLMSYGLSIYDEEDREEGRAIMQAMISPDEDDDEEEEDNEKEEDEEEEEDDEDDDLIHPADFLFDKKERA